LARRKRFLECAFLIPLRRDKNLSDGAPHKQEAWDWLETHLFQFGGGSWANETQMGFYVDPDTEERVFDESWRYLVAVPLRQVRHLRLLLGEACDIFQQKCIYLSVAGHVEFVSRRDDERP
jgi:hypothetical protein